MIPLDELRQKKGRLLGVDFGETRTGIAVSDISRFLASGIGNVRGGALDRSAELIAKKADEYSAVGVVIGLPRNMDGSEGARAERVRALAVALEERAPHLAVALLDERLSTVSASRYLNATDTRGQKRKQVIDTLSAEIILQNALDRLRQP